MNDFKYFGMGVLNYGNVRCLIKSEICAYSSWIKIIVFRILSEAQKAEAPNVLVIESFFIFREDRSTVK